VLVSPGFAVSFARRNPIASSLPCSSNLGSSRTAAWICAAGCVIRAQEQCSQDEAGRCHVGTEVSQLAQSGQRVLGAVSLGGCDGVVQHFSGRKIGVSLKLLARGWLARLGDG
jgi:hypothetical protein